MLVMIALALHPVGSCAAARPRLSALAVRGLPRPDVERSAVTMAVPPEVEGLTVVSASEGIPVAVTSLLLPSPEHKVRVTAFFTHFGDFNAWEYAQKLQAYRDDLDAVGAQLTAVGIGTQAAACLFSDQLDFPRDLLFADPAGACHKALGFSRGAFPGVQVSPYAKLFAMLLGIGSPGTIEAVLRGYTGDRQADSSWVARALAQGAAKGRFPADLPASAFDTVGREGLRPFELATLRLQNMVQGIMANWGDLAPSDPALTIQQGGTIVLDGDGGLVYRYADEGILVYTPVEEMIGAIKEAAKPARALGVGPETLSVAGSSNDLGS